MKCHQNITTSVLISKHVTFQDEQGNLVKKNPSNDVELTKEPPEGSLKNDEEDEKKEQKANTKPRQDKMTPNSKFKIQKKNSFWKRKGSSKVVPI